MERVRCATWFATTNVAHEPVKIRFMHRDCLRSVFHAAPFIAMLAWALFFPIRAAYGFCFQPYPTVRCEFLNSDAVFVGTVLSVRLVPPGAKPSIPIAFSGIDGRVYEFSVHEMFRGPHAKTIAVFTTNDDARVMLKEGETLLLFAFDPHDTKLASEFGTSLEIVNCGNFASASESQPAIRELRNIQVPDEAEVGGRISVQDTGAPVLGIEVVIHGAGRSFRASSDRNGWFHVQVPPGKYSAAVGHDRLWEIVPSDLSGDDPAHFTARKGRCSPLQFLATPR